MSQLYTLMAPRGAGKTTFCRALVDLAQAAGWDVAGLLSPAIFENGLKTGILTQNLRTGEARVLALASPPVDQTTFDLHFGHWRFDSTVLEWGNQILTGDLACDLLLVDELGPLELTHSAGWVNGLEALRQARYRWGLVVVRPELLAAARQVLPVAQDIPLDPAKDPARQAQVWWESSHNASSAR